MPAKQWILSATALVFLTACKEEIAQPCPVYAQPATSAIDYGSRYGFGMMLNAAAFAAPSDSIAQTQVPLGYTLTGISVPLDAKNTGFAEAHPSNLSLNYEAATGIVSLSIDFDTDQTPPPQHYPSYDTTPCTDMAYTDLSEAPAARSRRTVALSLELSHDIMTELKTAQICRLTAQTNSTFTVDPLQIVKLSGKDGATAKSTLIQTDVSADTHTNQYGWCDPQPYLQHLIENALREWEWSNNEVIIDLKPNS